ncbi:hypothetical protein CAPTEDRAFT_217665 [Capitella teleta]|uniref:Calponin-homology (CH) domain-containing protein n=1 Tax=Capitella teleta TaxID=283909 RepID=X2AMI5_CAPTE|nr:hypothetical protein CAPTEDRAFT_217665 [Capitella teleta]|eukprot:ELU00282.1 hypothetical protein CAPTEDRAFT_217665 [Capitella teleta]
MDYGYRFSPTREAGPGPPTPRSPATPNSEHNRSAYEESFELERYERDAVQKKTFTKWVNKHLIKRKIVFIPKAKQIVGDLFIDLSDGHCLLTLLEVLSGEGLPRERGRMRFHKMQNVQTALDFLKYKGIKYVNIRADEIVDGNPKLILGLIWTIILHFQGGHFGHFSRLHPHRILYYDIKRICPNPI